jgi:CMP-N,N'-diacetyllegionaminic acid synthase
VCQLLRNNWIGLKLILIVNLKENVIAIIPARSGSKGVPGKNIMLLGGYPLIAYSIAAAKLSGIKRVLVSTDSEEYALVTRRYGAETPFLRPDEISSDQSTDFEFMRHAIDWMIDKEKIVPEFWIHLRPTTPLRDPQIIKDALVQIQQHPEASSLRSGHEVPESPFKWFLKDGEGFFKGLREDLTPEKVNQPRQIFPNMYTPDGYVDIVRSSHVLHNTTLHGDKMLVFESPRCTEIDSLEDFEYLDYQIKKHDSHLLNYLKQFN